MRLVISIVFLFYLCEVSQQFVIDRTPATFPATTANIEDATSTTFIKRKRCSRPEIIGDVRSESETPLSLSRREVSLVERRRQQCEVCKNNPVCKKHKMCKTCDIICAAVETPTAAIVLNAEENHVKPQSDNLVSEARIAQGDITPEDLDKDRKILSSRMGEDIEKNQFETLGAIHPGSTMNLLARVLKIPNKDNFQHLIVLGKVKNPLANNPNNVIVDKANVFGSTVPKIVPEDLSKKIDEKKQDLKQDLTDAQIGQTVEEVAAVEPETQTRCALEDEVEEVFNVLPPPMPPRHHQAPQEYSSEGDSAEQRAKINPPVIQDNANILGEEEIQTTSPEVPKKHEEKARQSFSDSSEETGSISEEERQAEDPKDKIVEEALPSNEQVGQEESEELENKIINSIQESPRAQPESDNILKDHKDPEVPATNLEDSIMQVVKDSLKIPVDNNGVSKANPKSADPGPVVSDLEKNIMKVVDDSLKTADVPVLEATEEEVAEAPRDSGRALGDSLIEEIPKAVENVAHNLLHPDASNVEPEVNDIPQDVPTVSLQEAQEIPSSVDSQENGPELEARSEFNNDEKKYQSFGSLVPVAQPSDDPVKKVFFIGKDINLPLEMVKDQNGVLQLTVDMNKLCHCKEENCTRKHLDSEEKVSTLAMESPKGINEPVLPELLVNFGAPEGDENHTNIKRSANNIEKEDLVSKINGNYAFPADKFEKELQRIDKEVKEFNKENGNILREETLALVKNIESTQNVERMVELAHTVLGWMKNVADRK